MHPEMDFYGPLVTQPFLLESDIELIEAALSLILKPVNEQQAPPETIQIALALTNYLKECNNAFLASERIRLFLLLTLSASSIIIFISLLTLPISIITITSFCIFSFILFSVNLFTLYNQMSGCQQEIDWSNLKKVCADYAEKLHPANKPTCDLNKPLKSISSPTSAPCLFPARKISQNDDMNATITNDRLNHLEDRLPPIDDESLNKPLHSIKFAGM